MNPYIAGSLLGLVLLLAMYLSGRGLGASGGIKYCVVSLVGSIDADHVARSEYYSKYFEGGRSPLINWLSFEVLGLLRGRGIDDNRVFTGNFFSKVICNKQQFKGLLKSGVL